MITLVRREGDPASKKLEEKLQDLVLAYRTETISESLDTPVPHIKDNGKIISGDEIDTWLMELEDELSWQRSLSGDGCYIHPDTGKTC